jgi:hypothetical protein
MLTYLLIYPPNHLPITYLATHLPTYPPTYLPIYLPTHLPIPHLPTHLPTYPPMHPTTHLHTLPHTRGHLPTHLLTYPLTHLLTFYFLFFITYPILTYHPTTCYLFHTLVVIWNKHVKWKTWPKLNTFWCCRWIQFINVKVKSSILNTYNLCVFLKG